jgi:hypothetical protein
MRVEQNSGPVNIVAELRDIEILGFAKAKIYKFSGFDSNLIDLRMKMSSATLVGPYDINGKILILPVSGVGKIKLVFSECGCDYCLGLCDRLIFASCLFRKL